MFIRLNFRALCCSIVWLWTRLSSVVLPCSSRGAIIDVTRPNLVFTWALYKTKRSCKSFDVNWESENSAFIGRPNISGPQVYHWFNGTKEGLVNRLLYMKWLNCCFYSTKLLFVSDWQEQELQTTSGFLDKVSLLRALRADFGLFF